MDRIDLIAHLPDHGCCAAGGVGRSLGSPRHLEDDRAAEDVAGRGRISRQAEGWPRLCRLHPVSTAPLVSGRGGRHQPERLVQVFRLARLRCVVLSAADSGKNYFSPRIHHRMIQKSTPYQALGTTRPAPRQPNFGCKNAFRQPNGSRICDVHFCYDHGIKIHSRN